MARVQGVEVSDAVDPKQHGHAIDHELPEPLLACGLDDPRIAVAPVGAASGDQTDAIPDALEAAAVAVVFHFVEPDRAIRDEGRQSEGKIQTCGALLAERDGRQTLP